MIKLRPAVDVLLPASADQGRDYMSETTEAMQSGGGLRAGGLSLPAEQPVKPQRRNITVKKYFVLAILTVAAFVVSFGAAFAAGGGYGYTPDPEEEELWYKDISNDFVPYMQTLDITTSDGVIPVEFKLGINTIEIINFDGFYNYLLTLHPQYFGPSDPPYDDQGTAQYAMQIRGLEVYDSDLEDYVDCFLGGFPKIPTSYFTPVSTDWISAQCRVTALIENVATGDLIPAAWNGKDVYLVIPDNITED